MNLLKFNVFKRITEGNHVVVLTEVREIENESGGYVEFIGYTKDESQFIKQFFPSQLGKIVADIKKQVLPDEASVDANALIQKCLDEKIELDINYTKVQQLNTVTGEVRTYHNYNFEHYEVAPTAETGEEGGF